VHDEVMIGGDGTGEVLTVNSVKPVDILAVALTQFGSCTLSVQISCGSDRFHYSTRVLSSWKPALNGSVAPVFAEFQFSSLQVERNVFANCASDSELRSGSIINLG
jgi:hypothetical protein